MDDREPFEIALHEAERERDDAIRERDEARAALREAAEIDHAFNHPQPVSRSICPMDTCRRWRRALGEEPTP